MKKKTLTEKVKRHFDADTRGHAMTILHEDGLYRHLRFRRPDSSSYWFDIITSPGLLTINGDMGCYVFSRLEDMFEFFRSDLGRINASYWHEKIRCEGGGKAAEKFDPSKFRRVINEQVQDWLDGDEPLSREDYADLWHDINWQIFDELSDNDPGHLAFNAASQFSWRSDDGRQFRFRDLWDHDYNSYTFHYLWNCYAIAYAVQTYDQAKTGVAA